MAESPGEVYYSPELKCILKFDPEWASTTDVVAYHVVADDFMIAGENGEVRSVKDETLNSTGLLSFGHAMFFATGAYFTGIAFKSLELGLAATLAGIVVIGVLQGLLFGMVLPRVKGITFALVTLGFASVFFIIIQASELAQWTGADVGLQGVIVPDIFNTTNERYRLYLVALFCVFFISN